MLTFGLTHHYGDVAVGDPPRGRVRAFQVGATWTLVGALVAAFLEGATFECVQYLYHVTATTTATGKMTHEWNPNHVLLVNQAIGTVLGILLVFLVRLSWNGKRDDSQTILCLGFLYAATSAFHDWAILTILYGDDHVLLQNVQKSVLVVADVSYAVNLILILWSLGRFGKNSLGAVQRRRYRIFGAMLLWSLIARTIRYGISSFVLQRITSSSPITMECVTKLVAGTAIVSIATIAMLAMGIKSMEDTETAGDKDDDDPLKEALCPSQERDEEPQCGYAWIEDQEYDTSFAFTPV